jgi:lipid A 3-O-deacylase
MTVTSMLSKMAISLGILGAAMSWAQAPNAEAPVARLASSTPWDLGVLAQGGFGVTEDRSSFKFLMVGVHAGKVLTSEIGSGLFKGNFEYGVEVFPLWQAYTPKFQRANCYATPTAGATLVSPGLYCSPLFNTGGTYTGVSITPMILRWNLTHGTRWMPWVQGAGGMIWTDHKFPGFGSSSLSLTNDGPGTNTSVWNFTPQFGVGAHYFLRPQRSIDFAANAVHISSASLGDKNPGVNASVQFSLGYSWWK